MSLIEWSDSLSVNVAEIDRQHKKLVSMLNFLHDAMKTRKTGDVLGKTIADLITYAAKHFETEENYFAKYNYPDAAAHKKEHDDFVKEVTDFKKGYDEGRMMLSIDILRFLKDWLSNHINGTDKKYTAFFNEKGLK